MCPCIWIFNALSLTLSHSRTHIHTGRAVSSERVLYKHENRLRVGRVCVCELREDEQARFCPNIVKYCITLQVQYTSEAFLFISFFEPTRKIRRIAFIPSTSFPSSFHSENIFDRLFCDAVRLFAPVFSKVRMPWYKCIIPVLSICSFTIWHMMMAEWQR